MNRYCRAKLGFNCVNQSCAATSNDKWFVPTTNLQCTYMYEYPCEKCQYVTRNVRYDPNITKQECSCSK